jgi:hypothetical protein
MTEPRRIRDVYGDYQKGRIPFDTVVRAADDFLQRRERGAPSGSPAREIPAPQPPAEG